MSDTHLNVLPCMREWAEKTGALKPQPKNKVSGYAATPGMGPAGETCRTCKHASNICGGANSYWKCAVVKFRWTRGPGTDIRLKSPACRFWEAKEQPAGTSGSR